MDTIENRTRIAISDGKWYRSPRALILYLTILLAIAGYYLFRQATGYEFDSDWHALDVLRTRFWVIIWVLLSFAIVYLKRKSDYAPILAVLLVSVYFVVLYGMLFRGTEYGMNAHWGDNGNRIAEICKMMAYDSLFQDWYLKGLPSFYPPGWFALMAIYGKLLGIEAYQTIKFGYLLIFMAYPWLLYFSWKKLFSPATAATVTVVVLFFATRYLDWIYYEHITASLFMPWWLYYFEGGHRDKLPGRSDWRFYLAGGLYGGLIFLTYYYWFFMAAAALPFTLLARWVRTRSLKEVVSDLGHKTRLMIGVALVSSIFWLPLLISILKYGMASAQNSFFGLRHTVLSSHWDGVSLESIMIFIGVFFAFYLWQSWGRGKLPYLFLGGLMLILIDRLLNMDNGSLQSRKVLEFVHVFAAAPAGVGIALVWPKLVSKRNLARGLIGVALLASLVMTDTHVDAYKSRKFRIALKERVPRAKIDIIASVETSGKVFLTNRYIEACYLPYYLFIPINNMTAHTAGRYAQREALLDQMALMDDPRLLAYVMAYNRYDRVDYVYLPLNKETGQYELTLNQTRFNRKAELRPVSFAVDFSKAPEFFVKRHKSGVFEVEAPPRNPTVDNDIREQYPEVYPHLKDQS